MTDEDEDHLRDAVTLLSSRYGGHYGVMVHLMREVIPDARQRLVDALQANHTLFGPHPMYVDALGNDLLAATSDGSRTLPS